MKTGKRVTQCGGSGPGVVPPELIMGPVKKKKKWYKETGHFKLGKRKMGYSKLKARNSGGCYKGEKTSFKIPLTVNPNLNFEITPQELMNDVSDMTNYCFL